MSSDWADLGEIAEYRQYTYPRQASTFCVKLILCKVGFSEHALNGPGLALMGFALAVVASTLLVSDGEGMERAQPR